MKDDRTYGSILDDDQSVESRIRRDAKIIKAINLFCKRYAHIITHYQSCRISLLVRVVYSKNIEVVAGSTTTFLPVHRVEIETGVDLDSFKCRLTNLINNLIDSKYIDDDNYDITLNLRTV